MQRELEEQRKGKYGYLLTIHQVNVTIRADSSQPFYFLAPNGREYKNQREKRTRDAKIEVGDSRRGKRRSGNAIFQRCVKSLYFSCRFLPFSAHLRTAHGLACVPGGFLLCFFFCGSERKSYSRAKAKPR